MPVFFFCRIRASPVPTPRVSALLRREHCSGSPVLACRPFSQRLRHCPAARVCCGSPSVTVFYRGLHMHKTGRRMVTRQVQAATGLMRCPNACPHAWPLAFCGNIITRAGCRLRSAQSSIGSPVQRMPIYCPPDLALPPSQTTREQASPQVRFAASTICSAFFAYTFFSALFVCRQFP